MWLQVINKVKVTNQGDGHIKVKEKYLNPFQFYAVHTVSKWVVCIQLNAKNEPCCESFKQNYSELIKIFRIMCNYGQNIGLLPLVLIVSQKRALL